MSLPIFDGYEVAMQVRRCYASRVPVVLMTADGQAQEKRNRIGASAYLRKPFDMDDLIHVLQQTLAKQ